MNLPATIAVLILIIINSVLGLLLVLGKVKLVIVRRPTKQPDPQPDPLFHEVTVPEPPKKTRGRPRQFTNKRKARHLYLPPTVTKGQLGDVAELFQKYKAADGDRIILHVSTTEGAERDIEISYPVRWSSDVRDELSTVLGGWS